MRGWCWLYANTTLLITGSWTSHIAGTCRKPGTRIPQIAEDNSTVASGSHTASCSSNAFPSVDLFGRLLFTLSGWFSSVTSFMSHSLSWVFFLDIYLFLSLHLSHCIVIVHLHIDSFTRWAWTLCNSCKSKDGVKRLLFFNYKII